MENGKYLEAEKRFLFLYGRSRILSEYIIGSL